MSNLIVGLQKYLLELCFHGVQRCPLVFLCARLQLTLSAPNSALLLKIFAYDEEANATK